MAQIYFPHPGKIIVEAMDVENPHDKLRVFWRGDLLDMAYLTFGDEVQVNPAGRFESYLDWSTDFSGVLWDGNGPIRIFSTGFR